MRKNLIFVLAAVVLVAVVGVAFWLTGGGGDNNDGGDNVATVNGQVITRQQLDDRVNRMMASYGHQGANLSQEQQDMFAEGLEKEALDMLIVESLIIQEAEKRGIAIGAEQAEEHLQQIKAGYPNPEMFAQILAQQNLTEEELKEYFVYQLTEDSLYQDVTKDIKVDDQKVQDYYDENKEVLTKMKVRHIIFEAQEGTATEEDKQAAKEKAEAAIEELNNGADFAELAKEKSEGPTGPEGGLLDTYFTKDGSTDSGGTFAPGFAAGAFLLEEGEFSSEPVESQFGYHVIKVEDKVSSFEELEEDIKNQLIGQARNEAFTNFINDLKANAQIEQENA